MSRIHITLVGGQPAPVYNTIVAMKPEKVIFIYSQESHDTLLRVVREINVEYEQIKLDPIDIVETGKKAKELSDRYTDDEVSLNISSGTKIWSYFFAIAFEKKTNASIVFMDQNNVLWDLKNKTSNEDFIFDMHVLFRLYGNSLENNYRKFSEYTSQDIEVIDKIENVRRYNQNDFKHLMAVLDKQKQNQLRNNKNGRFELPSGSFVEWDKQDNNVRICLYKKGKAIHSTLNSPNIINLAFNSGWFELKIAEILSLWDKSKDICLNCKFPYVANIDKNEVDIIVNTGNKILFVECKTQITNTTDIDKFRSVVKTYGGMGSKALFVTDAKMSNIAKQKCEEHNILSFSLQDEHLGLPPYKDLQLLLDNELFNINTV